MWTPRSRRARSWPLRTFRPCGVTVAPAASLGRARSARQRSTRPRVSPPSARTRGHHRRRGQADPQRDPTQTPTVSRKPQRVPVATPTGIEFSKVAIRNTVMSLVFRRYGSRISELLSDSGVLVSTAQSPRIDRVRGEILETARQKCRTGAVPAFAKGGVGQGAAKMGRRSAGEAEAEWRARLESPNARRSTGYRPSGLAFTRDRPRAEARNSCGVS